ncbi:MAG: peptide chain release factor-like protein [bacterium]|nr:peptide chain release factor-like protein [bacterium]
MHPARLSPEELLQDCSTRQERRSGPGGQHRNKVETAVVVKHEPTGFLGDASERRSQAANRSQAIRRLRLKLATDFRSSSHDAGESPSVLWQSRVRNGKLAISAEHDDFPSMLAECLDVLAAADYDLLEAATKLTTSNSQLIKLLRKHPPALMALNRARTERGLAALK